MTTKYDDLAVPRTYVYYKSYGQHSTVLISENNCSFSAAKFSITVLLTKTTAAQNEYALSYYKVRGLYFLVVVFVGIIVSIVPTQVGGGAV